MAGVSTHVGIFLSHRQSFSKSPMHDCECFASITECPRAVPGGGKFGRGEKLFGQISKPSLVPNISFNFKDSLCHIEPEGAITTLFFFPL